MIKRLFVLLLLTPFVLLQLLPLTAGAQGVTIGDINSINKNREYYREQCSGGGGAGATPVTGGPLTADSKIYILGDSITAGAKDKYKAKMPNATISARVSRSWTGPGQESPANTGTQGSGENAFTTDSADSPTQRSPIADAQGIIIALGSNHFSEGNPIDTIIDKFKGVNGNAPIWWINTALVGYPQVPGFNESLAAAETAGKIKVINWSNVVDPGGDGTDDPNDLLSDFVHPNDTGSTALVDLVASSVVSGAASPQNKKTTGCVCVANNDKIKGLPANGPNIQRAFEFFINQEIDPKITAEQSAGIVGNLILESQVDPTAVNPSSGATGIAQWLGGRLTNMRNWTTENNMDPNSFEGQLAFLWYEVTEGEERTGGFDPLGNLQKIKGEGPEVARAAAIDWSRNFERGGPGADKERGDYAVGVYDKYKNLVSTTTTTGSPVDSQGGCNSAKVTTGNSDVAKKIIETGLLLAWPEQQAQGLKNKENATPAYQEAMPKYNGAEGNDEWSDCGVFVATVMRMSGADPNYHKRWTPEQANYVRSQTEKYLIVENVTSTEQLQPGDIVINSHHTMIFVGEQPGGFNTIDASQGDRVPGAKVFSAHPSGEAYIIARILN